MRLNQHQPQLLSPKKRKRKKITASMPSTTLEGESRFLASVVVASPTQLAVVDYSEDTNSSSSPSPLTMVAMAAINLNHQEDIINLVKAPWAVEA